ncbi:hypothetical protein QAD02_020823 [Eretmocerus hayati]|uniref:Uncharacterized protein n=1 Tax=Eretmocerus hayati TaxID=131215 RepID=A0ACC2PN42_9HYME|nr:hypothetical protein QAD02_020823 [Eretmocerus hayati]
MGDGDTGVKEVPLQGQKSSFEGAEEVGAHCPSDEDVCQLEDFVRWGTKGPAPRKVAATELEEATGQVAGLTIGNKSEAKASESKPPPAATPANSANANGGQKGKGRGRRGGKKNENGTSAGEAAETAAVTTNATKPAGTPAPTRSAPPPPIPPAPQAGPWGYPDAPTRREVDPGQFEWPPSPPSDRRTTTPPRPVPRPIPSSARGEAAGVAAPDEFREPALFIAPPDLPASERHELEAAVELQLRDNWDPERGWQGYLDQRDEAARILRPDQPVQYPQSYRGKRTRIRSEWTPEVALQIRRERIQARDLRRAMEREYERLSARSREPERPRHQEEQHQRQVEPMLRHDDSPKRRRRNPSRHMSLEDHADFQVPTERDDSPPPGGRNLGPSPTSPRGSIARGDTPPGRGGCPGSEIGGPISPGHRNTTDTGATELRAQERRHPDVKARTSTKRHEIPVARSITSGRGRLSATHLFSMLETWPSVSNLPGSETVVPLFQPRSAPGSCSQLSALRHGVYAVGGSPRIRGSFWSVGNRHLPTTRARGAGRTRGDREGSGTAQSIQRRCFPTPLDATTIRYDQESERAGIIEVPDSTTAQQRNQGHQRARAVSA